jgi:hypothetical protein
VSLSTLLSRALVAFTIEVDNELERRMPHRTTVGTGPGGPWLTSLAMWANCLRIAGDGVTVAELERRNGYLGGMERWGYLRVAPDPARRPKPPRRDWLVQPTAAGRRAQEAWRPLPELVEGRWAERFGRQATDALRAALEDLVARLDPGLPDYLPVIGHGGFTEPRGRLPIGPPEHAQGERLDLSTLLARPLIAFTAEFEAASELSLPVTANALRVLAGSPAGLRELPRLTGTAKEAVAVAVAYLTRHHFAAEHPDQAGPGKVVALTARGRVAAAAGRRLADDIADRWTERFGAEPLAAVQRALEPLAGSRDLAGSPLADGLEPPPGSWRANAPRPERLPHHPVVSHRGGYPDGS